MRANMRINTRGLEVEQCSPSYMASRNGPAGAESTTPLKGRLVSRTDATWRIALSVARPRTTPVRLAAIVAWCLLGALSSASCVPTSQPGVIGASGGRNSLNAWLGPCPSSAVIGLQVFRSYPGWDPETDRPLWSARFDRPLETGTPINLNSLPPDTIESGSISSALSGGEVALAVSRGRTGATGVAYVTFRPSELSPRSVWLDGREISPGEFRRSTRESCQS